MDSARRQSHDELRLQRGVTAATVARAGVCVAVPSVLAGPSAPLDTTEGNSREAQRAAAVPQRALRPSRAQHRENLLAAV